LCFSSPLGWINIVAENRSVKEISFVNSFIEHDSSNVFLKEVESELEEYFNGQRKEFTFHCDPDGTDFQKKVWNELFKIPYGKTVSYLEIARRLGDEKVIRAAASANGKNPIAIVIPCHRVIGSDGSLTGYAGGLHRKEWLLSHEMGVYSPSLFDQFLNIENGA
jgi:methylated-DNA-[protein]-cysteine S-methyltransferase